VGNEDPLANCWLGLQATDCYPLVPDVGTLIANASGPASGFEKVKICKVGG